MIDILILLLINSALCFGFWNACYYELSPGGIEIGSEYDLEKKPTESKGVLWFIEKWASKYWFHKPICGCLPCMASFHSIYPYWTYMYAANCINLNAILFYPVYILALSGLNYIINEKI